MAALVAVLSVMEDSRAKRKSSKIEICVNFSPLSPGVTFRQRTDPFRQLVTQL